MARRMTLATLGLTLAVVASTGSGQVTIDMPAPPRAPQAAADTSPASAAAADLGEVALRRYARSRTWPRDTYFAWSGWSGGYRFHGYRYWGHPYWGHPYRYYRFRGFWPHRYPWGRAVRWPRVVFILSAP